MPLMFSFACIFAPITKPNSNTPNNANPFATAINTKCISSPSKIGDWPDSNRGGSPNHYHQRPNKCRAPACATDSDTVAIAAAWIIFSLSKKTEAALSLSPSVLRAYQVSALRESAGQFAVRVASAANHVCRTSHWSLPPLSLRKLNSSVGRIFVPVFFFELYTYPAISKWAPVRRRPYRPILAK